MANNRNPLAGLNLADKAKAWSETDLTKSPKQRAKGKGRRAAENTERIQIDIVEGVGELLDKAAAELNTTRSAVAEYLLMRGLSQGDIGELRLLLVPARSPRYEFKLARQSLDQWRADFARWQAEGRQ